MRHPDNHHPDQAIAGAACPDRAVEAITLADIIRMTEILGQIARSQHYPAIARHLERALEEALDEAAAEAMLRPTEHAAHLI